MNRLGVAAACLLDDCGRLLVVRKRGTEAFMLPGGKHKPGESDLDTVLREVKEEVGLCIDILAPLGRWTAKAANEPDTEITATVFLAELNGTPAASGEIDELAWVDPTDPGDRTFAPLMATVFAELVTRRR